VRAEYRGVSGILEEIHWRVHLGIPWNPFRINLSFGLVRGNPLSPFGQCQSGSFGSPSEGLLGVLLGGKFVVGNHLDRWVKTEFNIKETILCNYVKCLNIKR
jgi:hypothetical protein